MQTRRYNGKIYKFYGSYATKGLAKEAVASLKRTHWNGRIVERKRGSFGVHGPWEVYARKGKV